MYKLLKLLLIGVLSFSFSITVASADIIKGQKLYTKKLKNLCEMTGAKMASQHSQDEWEDIQNREKLQAEIIRLCPNVKNVKEKYIAHYYDFFFEYANDSGNIPSCK